MLPVTAFTHDELDTVEECASIVLNPRRLTIIELIARHGQMDVRELTEKMAEREVGENYSSEDRKRIYISAHQVHLGKLDDLGVISRTRDQVAPGKNLGEVHAFARAILRAHAKHL